MRLSESFTKPLRQPPKDADTVNHRLLSQAGYVDQLMAGVFSYLPLGLRVLNNIAGIVREEMTVLGSEEILMPQLHPKVIWETTGGWDNVDVLFKVPSRTKKEYVLGQSEEEVVTPLVMSHVKSYKDLPVSVFQIHWKFRDELRAKSGIMRGREFYMKDMYSFHETEVDFLKYYEQVKRAYVKTFKRLGLTAKVTEASGGNFSDKISYEFEVLTDAGEDVIYYCDKCDFCVEDEIAKVQPGDKCPKCGKGILKEARAAEVGNVFELGQKFSKDFKLTFADKDDAPIHPHMGCFGIGISRVMGVIVEDLHDDKGIVWPESVAPYAVHLISLGGESGVKQATDKLYDNLGKAGVEVLYDDRDESAGVKFNDADLIGIPQRVTISQSTLAKRSVELKPRHSEKTELIKLADVAKRFTK